MRRFFVAAIGAICAANCQLDSAGEFSPVPDIDASAGTGAGGVIGQGGMEGFAAVGGAGGSSGGRAGAGGTVPDAAVGAGGTSGFDASAGTSGSGGNAGAFGTNGTSGSGATGGMSGTAGRGGTLGTSGMSGASGTFGVSGTLGTGGTAGTNGASGTAGTGGRGGTSGTAGTAGTGGTAGTNGTAGTSGAAGTAGTAGTGGTGGTAGTAGTTGTGGTGGIVTCESCDLPQDVCCRRGSTYLCLEQPNNCDTTFRCDDASDCPGQICCAHLEQAGYTSFTCDDTCTVTEDTDIGCSGPHHCSGDQVCCGEITNDMSPASHYQRTRCMTQCQSSGPLTRYVLCLTNADCPAQTTCMASALLPTGFRFCR